MLTREMAIAVSLFFSEEIIKNFFEQTKRQVKFKKKAPQKELSDRRESNPHLQLGRLR